MPGHPGAGGSFLRTPVSPSNYRCFVYPGTLVTTGSAASQRLVTLKRRTLGRQQEQVLGHLTNTRVFPGLRGCGTTLNRTQQTPGR